MVKGESHRRGVTGNTCDPIWHVISHSGEVISRTAISTLFCLLCNLKPYFEHSQKADELWQMQTVGTAVF